MNGDDEIEDWLDAALAADPMGSTEFEDKPRGPPLTPQEIRSARATLAESHSPPEFLAAIAALLARCRSREFFNNPRLKFLHGAYVLAEFARHKLVDKVRLAREPEQWPDGYVSVGREDYPIEVTSTHGCRRLGKEYSAVTKPTLDPVFHWIGRANAIPTFLDKAIKDKVAKIIVRVFG